MEADFVIGCYYSHANTLTHAHTHARTLARTHARTHTHTHTHTEGEKKKKRGYKAESVVWTREERLSVLD